MSLTSLEMTSSFFWSSPWMLEAPCNPVKLEMPALCTNDAICLHARAMLESTMVSSPSIAPACSFFSNHVVRVVMSYWLFCCCSGAAAAGSASTETAALTEALLFLKLTIRCFPAPRPTTDPCSEDPATDSFGDTEVREDEEFSQLTGATARLAERIAWVVAIAAAIPSANSRPTILMKTCQLSASVQLTRRLLSYTSYRVDKV